MNEEEVLTEEQMWTRLDEGLTKADRLLDGCKVKEVFPTEKYIKNYDYVYKISSDSSNHQALIASFKKPLESGIESKVLPSLMDKDGSHLLTDFLQLWRNYKMMTRCLIRFFDYLDRQIEDQEDSSPRLVDISFCIFHELVCEVLHQRLMNATKFLISQHLHRVQIDEHLLPGISLCFVEFGEHGYKSYYDMFEKEILKDAESYYSGVASGWYSCYSSIDYVLKVEQCLYEEKRSASEFLQQSSTKKLLQVVHSQMLDQYADKLAEKLKAEKMDSKLYQAAISRCSDMVTK